MKVFTLIALPFGLSAKDHIELTGPIGPGLIGMRLSRYQLVECTIELSDISPSAKEEVCPCFLRKRQLKIWS